MQAKEREQEQAVLGVAGQEAHDLVWITAGDDFNEAVDPSRVKFAENEDYLAHVEARAAK